MLKRLTIGLIVLLTISACDNDPVSEQAISSQTGYSDVTGVKIEVGKPAPLFSLQNSQGKTVQLEGFQNKSNVMLLFYRGYWCPFCIGHLDDLQSLLPELAANNIQLIAISPDDAENSQKLAERFDQPYLFVSDEKLKVTDLYGIRRDEKLPHPAVILIDKAGIVQWFYIGENYKQRPSSSQLRDVIARLFNDQ